MNIMQFKYAVEVARYGSINKAAEALYVAQPNLSRYIRELEDDLGVELLSARPGVWYQLRTARPSFNAQQVLNQIDDIEKLYKGDGVCKRRFSISVPRASYIADAFVQFSRHVDACPTIIYYMETNTRKAIRNLLESDYRLGIIRYAAEDDTYFKSMLDEKGIAFQLVTDVTYVLIMSQNSPLAEREEIHSSDLAGLIQITHGDPFVPALTPALRDEATMEYSERTILLFERGGQFDLLCENEQTYMWVSPLPEKLLKRYGLVQRDCHDKRRVYRDVLIHRKDYELTDLDRQFIEELMESKRKTLG